MLACEMSIIDGYSLLDISRTLNVQQYRFTQDEIDRRDRRLAEAGVRDPEWYLEHGFDSEEV